MELLHQQIIWLADKLRISYGEGALLALLQMIAKASVKFPLKDKRGKSLPAINQSADISLRWPQWFAPTYADRATEATTLDVLRSAALISQETAVKSIADHYDIEDVPRELTRIKSDDPPPNTMAAKPIKPGIGESND
jgi:hypothetical protein